MKSLMSMNSFLNKVGLQVVESFGVEVAIDDDNPSWTGSAYVGDEDSIGSLRSELITIYDKKLFELKNKANEPTVRTRSAPIQLMPDLDEMIGLGEI